MTITELLQVVALSTRSHDLELFCVDNDSGDMFKAVNLTTYKVGEKDGEDIIQWMIEMELDQ